MGAYYWIVPDEKPCTSGFFGPSNNFSLLFRNGHFQMVFLKIRKLKAESMKFNFRLYVTVKAEGPKAPMFNGLVNFTAEKTTKCVKFSQTFPLHLFCEVEEVSNAVPAPFGTFLNTAEAMNVRSIISNRFFSDFRQCLRDEDSKDVTFKIGQRELKAHKLILSARSSVFKRMFSVDMQERRSSVVEVVDYSFECFSAFLEFIYSGKCTAMMTHAAELLDAAEKYDIIDLKLKTAFELLDKIKTSNAIEVLILLHRYNIDIFKQKVIKFIARHRLSIFHESAKQQLEKNHPQLALELYSKMAFQ